MVDLLQSLGDDYLSIADEIRTQEQWPRDGEPGGSWEVRLPTTLVWLDATNSTLPVDNPQETLDAFPNKRRRNAPHLAENYPSALVP